jgi:CO dehydrogenase/acetyl-CoA synthase gamma subunit (corrinoid Fe-S protein)
MATDTPTFNQLVKPPSFVAGEAIGAHLCVIDQGDGTVDLSAAGGPITGVAKKAALIGHEVAVDVPPSVVMIVAGAAISANAEVMATAAGKVITATVGSFSVVGKLTNNTSAAADNDLVAVQLYARGQVVTAPS